MKKNSLVVIFIAILILGCSSTNQNATTKVSNDPVKYAATITSEELKTKLYTYASDEFEGRETGEIGQKKAVNYLKDQYMNLGIASPLSGDDYFQEVPVEKQKAPLVELSINGSTMDNYLDYIIKGSAETQILNTDEIVFAGYGIESEKYSDYKNTDVKGKILLIKAGEPKDDAGNFITTGTSAKTKWSSGSSALSAKRLVAQEQGAKAVLFYAPDLLSQYGPYYKKLADAGVAGRMSVKNAKSKTVFFIIGDLLAKALHPEVTSLTGTQTISVNLKADIKSTSEQVETENVVAFIKGNEKPEEILVISAHLDHEGVKEGKVYNGADDDGSGTVAMLEIAEAFKAAMDDGFAPKRSILFLHVTGEEKGLLGSSYYTDNDPIFPLEQTVANLNIDMIGRVDEIHKMDENYVYLIGSDKLSTDLHVISEKVNSKYTNINIDYRYNDDNDPNRYYYRSDHYNFAKNNIPVIFYFNGTHDDYHQPSDTPDKIEYDLLEKRTRLVFHTAWEVANLPERPRIDQTEAE